MPEYRVYVLDDDGHFKTSTSFVFDSDDVAKQETQKLVEDHDVELWQHDRMVATLKRKSDLP